MCFARKVVKKVLLKIFREFHVVWKQIKGKMRKMYRVTTQLVQNLPLTSAKPKQNFCFEVNGWFCAS